MPISNEEIIANCEVVGPELFVLSGELGYLVRFTCPCGEISRFALKTDENDPLTREQVLDELMPFIRRHIEQEAAERDAHLS